MRIYRPPTINKALKYTGEKQRVKYEEMQKSQRYESSIHGVIARCVGAFYVLMGWGFAVDFDRGEDWNK